MKLWRYMPISHYVNLISTQRLYIPKTKHLSDILEGTWFSKTEIYFHNQKISYLKNEIQRSENVLGKSESEFNAYLGGLSNFSKNIELSIPGDTMDYIDGRIDFEKLKNLSSASKRANEMELEILEFRVSDVKSYAEQTKNRTFVSSWSQSDEQNLALWKIFGKGDDAIAITTTMEKLQVAISKNEPYLRKHGLQAVVKEVNYIKEINKPGNSTYGKMLELRRVNGYEDLASLLVKPKPYAFENEVRVVAFPYLGSETCNFEGLELEVRLTGIKFSEGLTGETPFIEEVYLPPHLSNSSPQYKSLVELNKKYGLSPNLIQIDRIDID